MPSTTASASHANAGPTTRRPAPAAATIFKGAPSARARGGGGGRRRRGQPAHTERGRKEAHFGGHEHG